MVHKKKKLLIHFSTNNIAVYKLYDGTVAFLFDKSTSFSSDVVNSILFEKIDNFFRLYLKDFNLTNESVCVYATGIFQKYDAPDKNKIVTHIYVMHGLYFNIIPLDLEQFYLSLSKRKKSNNILEGLVVQEFRRIVICGSFQQHLKEIGDIMEMMRAHNIEVLSPWTTKIVPETIGTNFILLEGQEPLRNERDAWRHKYEHMEKFKYADAIVVCNPGGIVGIGTIFELGFMIAFSKRIIFTDIPENIQIPFPYEVGLNFS